MDDCEFKHFINLPEIILLSNLFHVKHHLIFTNNELNESYLNLKFFD
jgi:hypothetical protein